MLASRTGWTVGAAVLLVLLASVVWVSLDDDGLGDAIVVSNGRMEAVEIDLATRIPGRVAAIMVTEGDFVTAGETLARMDTAVLEAQRREADAQMQQALIGIEVARSRVAQSEAERTAAEAVVAQRAAQLRAAEKRLARSRELAAKGSTPQQVLDDDLAAAEGARAALGAARAQVAAAEAALGTARSRVVAAQVAVEAMRGTIARIAADIEDALLKAPRDGRVQYRVAQPGEVLPAGGVVLNLVDLTDVYMTLFLPTAAAGRLAIGSEARLIFDAAPHYVVPGAVSFVADVAQFTPKTVETESERQKLMFRVKIRIDPELLRRYIRSVKTGLPGVAYVKLDPRVEWPQQLQVHLPE
ncbi:MAG: HlyD family efflux transporter periplasmic adaptor subunit [Pseudomonadota bacterium]|nr:HlyD family efflux transporter periplasmic adaptor subunit [Pseudomonadota bacterium]